MRQAVSVVDILVASKTAEYGLTQQPRQQVARVLATPPIRQRRAREIGQAEGVVQFTIGEQSGVGGDARTVEFQPQATVEIDPQSAVC